MKCPVDGETLVMTERSGVEIDYCPQCRGVWLDRGELDKILDRTETTTPPPLPAAGRTAGFGAPAAQPTAAPDLHGRPQFEDRDRDRDRRDSHRDRDDDDHYRGGKKKRRESFLGDLFDF